MNDPKVYVEVTAAFDSSGRLIPLSLVWEDGRRFAIDRVLEVRPMAAMKAGGQGDRYTIRIGSRQSYLFFERSASLSGSNIGRWFVERRLP